MCGLPNKTRHLGEVVVQLVFLILEESRPARAKMNGVLIEGLISVTIREF